MLRKKTRRKLEGPKVFITFLSIHTIHMTQTDMNPGNNSEMIFSFQVTFDILLNHGNTCYNGFHENDKIFYGVDINKM